MSEEKKLAGYCGMYCNACAIHTGEIKKAITQLRELLDMYEIARVQQLFGGLEGFPQFLKVLGDLETLFGTCVGCKAGGGWPNCFMRKCCVEKDLEFCYECGKMPCQELLKFQKKHFLHPSPHYAKT